MQWRRPTGRTSTQRDVELLVKTSKRLAGIENHLHVRWIHAWRARIILDSRVRLDVEGLQVADGHVEDPFLALAFPAFA